MNPHLVYSDARGRIFDHPFYEMLVHDGHVVRPPQASELIPVPAGSDLFMLPGRTPLGFNPETGGPEVLRGAFATSTFISPAYLRLALPATVRDDDAPDLPLFAYAPLGFSRGRFVTTAVRVDRSNRQDPTRFNLPMIRRLAARMLRAYPENRLIRHLHHCATVYGCRAAQNFMIGREECPLPSSPACNAACLGCLSESPAGEVRSSHDRITFIPTPEELSEVALLHIRRVRQPVVSFGQGCEGEPLLVADTLAAAIRRIRHKTDRGTIHLNTNGSRPDAVASLLEAGLDSIRLSINSFQPRLYEAYFRPRHYALTDVIESGRRVREAGGFVSVNLLVFPGLSDRSEDIAATIDGLRACGADFVQMRNLNIDPDIYRSAMDPATSAAPGGLTTLMGRILDAIPTIRFGYFNPPVRTLTQARRRALAGGRASAR